MFNPSITPPSTLFIETTITCNYNCRYCHMWMNNDPKNRLTTEEKLNTIREFKTLNQHGEVVLTGGETMTNQTEFFEITRLCRELDLICACNTNASFISEENIEQIVADGPRYLVVSLDSHDPEIHDYSRGVKGSWSFVVNTLKNLIQIRNGIQSPKYCEILTNTVIFDQNIVSLLKYLDFAEHLQLDGITFQMLSRTFYNKNKRRDKFFDDHFFKEKQKAKHALNTLINILPDHPIIRTSRNDFEWMKEYIDDPEFIGKSVCASHENNIMVDATGDVQLCFNMRKLTNSKAIGNIRTQRLEELWISERTSDVRNIMDSCNRNCGMLNCHRRKI